MARQCSCIGFLLLKNVFKSTVKNMRGWWKWALVSPDGVAPSRRVGVSPSVNLPLHHKVQKFSSGTGSPGWSQKKGRKTVVVLVVFKSTYRLSKCRDISLLSLLHVIMETVKSAWYKLIMKTLLGMIVLRVLGQSCCHWCSFDQLHSHVFSVCHNGSNFWCICKYCY